MKTPYPLSNASGFVEQQLSSEAQYQTIVLQKSYAGLYKDLYGLMQTNGKSHKPLHNEHKCSESIVNQFTLKKILNMKTLKQSLGLSYPKHKVVLLPECGKYILLRKNRLFSKWHGVCNDSMSWYESEKILHYCTYSTEIDAHKVINAKKDLSFVKKLINE